MTKTCQIMQRRNTSSNQRNMSKSRSETAVPMPMLLLKIIRRRWRGRSKRLMRSWGDERQAEVIIWRSTHVPFGVQYMALICNEQVEWNERALLFCAWPWHKPQDVNLNQILWTPVPSWTCKRKMSARDESRLVMGGIDVNDLEMQPNTNSL